MVEPLKPDYQQPFLLPPSLEDWVPADHPARFLRQFVDLLDLPKLGFKMPENLEGRRPYAPSLLLKIWLYGYFHRIRASRQLEVACREQLSLLWLSGMIQPDHNTLWRFWRDNHKALRNIFTQSVKMATQVGAVGLVLQALDGTKIEAACSGYSGWSKEYIEKVLAQLDAAMEQIEGEVREANAEQPASGYRLPESLSEQQALREQLQQALAQLQADGRQHYHPKEPEARRMKLANGSSRYAYNAQAVADSKAGVIVACDANRQETDNGQLVAMSQQAKQNVGSGTPVTLADKGYGAGADLQAAEQAKVSVLVPPAEGAPGEGKRYGKAEFHYDASNGSVSCPEGRQLDYEGQTTKNGVRVQRYRCHCRNCPQRAQCTSDPKGRQIEVWPHTATVQAMRQRLKEPEAKALYDQRSSIIERRFAQLKWHDGFRRWSVRGLDAVRTQWSMLCATLNLRVLYSFWKHTLPATVS